MTRIIPSLFIAFSILVVPQMSRAADATSTKDVPLTSYCFKQEQQPPAFSFLTKLRDFLEKALNVQGKLCDPAQTATAAEVLPDGKAWFESTLDSVTDRVKGYPGISLFFKLFGD